MAINSFLQFITFLAAVVAAFVIPGVNLLKPLRISFFETIVLGTTVGIVLWAIQGYVFGLLGIRWFSFIYLTINVILFSLINKSSLKVRIPKIPKNLDVISILIVLSGTLLNLTAVWFIGTRDASGLYFCCRGVPDAIYHLSLTNELLNNFPPFEPGMTGIHVKNYHYLSNLVAAEISRVFNLDYVHVQFQYLSLLIALLLGSTGFVLARILKLGKVFSRWLAIFVYGSGDILYILLFLRGKGFNFNVTIFDDATKLLAGPPRSFSIVIIFAAICLLAIWVKKRSLYAGLVMATLMGVLVGFKVYTGIFALSGLGVLGAYYLMKKDFRMLIPPLLALILSLAYYIPNNRNAGFLYFNGMWRFENFMQHKDLAISKLDFLRLDSSIQHKYLQAVGYELLFVILYYTFLYGTVNIGFFQSKRSLGLLPRELNIFLISAIIVSLIAGSFFYQSTGGANTVQFLLTVFIMGSVYASLSITYWFKKIPKKFGVFLFVVIFILTTARSTYEVASNIYDTSIKKGFRITNQQLMAFDYLKNKTPQHSIIAFEPWMAEDESFMYVTFLTNRDIFLAGAGVLRDHGQDTASRERDVKTIFTGNNSREVEQVLKNNHINYLFLPNGYNLSVGKESYLRKVFENQSADILQVIY